MKKIIIVCIALLICTSATSQIRIFRTEFAPHDTRENAVTGSRFLEANYWEYRPQSIGEMNGIKMFGSKIKIPTTWIDYNVYIHLENIFSAYELAINDNVIAVMEDPYTPADYEISKFIQQGENDVILLLRESRTPLLQQPRKPSCEIFSGSCIYSQYKVHVQDYTTSIQKDENGVNRMYIDVQVKNNFNGEEPVKLGYDVYSPEGKLLDYGLIETQIDGRSEKLIRINAPIGDINGSLWSSEQPKLYRAMLFLKRDGKPKEYIPIYVGAGSTTVSNGHVLRNGKPVEIKWTSFSSSTEENDKKALTEIKKKGFNTIVSDIPMSGWVYDQCDKIGLYVIERASINPNFKPEDRSVEGTPSNRPEFLGEYLERTKGMYYRTHGHVCIIGYMTSGNDAGNGYNLYKTYQMLKQLNSNRLVITPGAQGEWNSDPALQ
ncbi:MAG: hypothetical protein KBS95_00475 [Alistipes sp.]|nr:hypothetical protein [Candidatus Alistipes equi]